MAKILPEDRRFEAPAVSSTEIWCYNHAEVISYYYSFNIENFSWRKEKTGKFIRSPTFTSSNNDELKWCLHIFPRGLTKEDENYVSLYLNLVSAEMPEFHGKFKFAILNQFKTPIKELVGEVKSSLECKSWGFNKFIRRNVLLDPDNYYLPYGKLLVRSKFSIVFDPTNSCGQISSAPFKVPECRLSGEFGDLFENPKFSDVVIKSANGGDFHAHKAILAARSPVFAAMFSHDMKETPLNRVEITDMNYDVLKEMLRFIYTGNAPNLESMARELLEASNKYAIGRLKVMCEEALGKELTIDNVPDMLILADMHNAEQLMSFVTDFMTLHATDVMNTTGWKAMAMQRAHLAADTFKNVFARLARRRQPSS